MIKIKMIFLKLCNSLYLNISINYLYILNEINQHMCCMYYYLLLIIYWLAIYFY